MKIKIPDKCSQCQFYVLEVYNYYRCILYNKLRNKYEPMVRPAWCRAVEVNVLEVSDEGGKVQDRSNVAS